MAVRFDGANVEYMSVTAGLPTTYTAFTFAAFYRIDAGAPVQGHFSGIFTLVDAVAASKGWLLATDTDARSLVIYNFGAGLPVISTGVQLVTETWYFIALSVVGTGTNETTLYVYRLDTDALATYTGTANGTLTGAPAAAVLGYSGYNVETFNGRIAASRIWSVALTNTELDQHRRIGRAVAQLGSLVNDLPLRDPTLADNNTARTGTNWTQTGTLAVEDGPPIAWGGERQTMLLGVG
jgi:hypothetical protein